MKGAWNQEEMSAKAKVAKVKEQGQEGRKLRSHIHSEGKGAHPSNGKPVKVLTQRHATE